MAPAKRARTSELTSSATDSIKKEETARKAGLRPYETVEGRKWLMKALNPNDIAVNPTGIPSLHSQNISVLNWQGEYSIDVPSGLSANSPSYDSTMYLYQHPLIFGMSAARQNGCHDLREVGEFVCTFGYKGTAVAPTGGCSFTITPQDPLFQIALTKCSVYLNNQINPAVFGGRTQLASRRKMFSQLTQRNRMIYGGATIIPTCSDDNNGGSIAISQQIFNPRRVDTGIAPETDPDQVSATILQFNETDFPNTSDTVQNPQMYYSRFQDGAYIPYKMANPHQFDYRNSEDQIVTQAPYYITGVSFLIARVVCNNQGIWTCPEAVKQVDATLIRDTNSNNFSIGWSSQSEASTTDKWYLLEAIRFYVVTYTGQSGYFDISGASGGFTNTVPSINGIVAAGNLNQDATTWDAINSTMLWSANGLTPLKVAKMACPKEFAQVYIGDYTSGGVRHWNFPGSLNTAIALSTSTSHFTDQASLVLKIPQLLLAYDKNGAADYLNPWGLTFTSLDVIPDALDKDLRHSTICPYNGNYITAIHISGASNTAPIKMLMKMGCEILLVASSPYSPFRFMSPKYDESAIKTYARCIRSMRDAYFANAGSIPGQNDYLNRLNILIETDSADELNSVLNQGGQWLGTVGV